jgi:hypothetical protein
MTDGMEAGYARLDDDEGSDSPLVKPDDMLKPHTTFMQREQFASCTIIYEQRGFLGSFVGFNVR